MNVFTRCVSAAGALGLLSIGLAGSPAALVETAAAAGGGGCTGSGGAPSGSTQVFASQFTGRSATAAFSSVSGTTETDVFIAAQVFTSVQSGAGSTSGTVAFVGITVFDQITMQPSIEAFGCTSRPNFQIDRMLTSATLGSTSVPMIDAISGASSVATVAASWTGVGSLTRSVSIGVFHSGRFTMTNHFIGSSRSAQAAGSASDPIAGVSLGGSAIFAQLDSVKSGSTFVCVGTCGK